MPKFYQGYRLIDQDEWALWIEELAKPIPPDDDDEKLIKEFNDERHAHGQHYLH